MAIFEFAQGAIHHMALHASGSQMHFQITHHNIFKDEEVRRQKLFVKMKKIMPRCARGWPHNDALRYAKPSWRSQM